MILDSYISLRNWRNSIPKNKTVVVSNGCFDLIHLGHTTFLTQAKNLGDYLVVGINSDASIKKLKGKNRPINHQYARAIVLNTLKPVDVVFIFNSIRCDTFLEFARPDIYTKAGDYNIKSLDKSEKQVLRNFKSKIKFIPFVNGYSTTSIINKINS